MLHIPLTNLLLLAAKQEPYKKNPTLSLRFFCKKFNRMDQQAEKRKKRTDRKSNRTRQKNKRADSKVASNDSPEIPDRGETSDILSLPSGVERKKKE